MRWSWRTWKALSLNATACLARTREIRDCQNVFIMIFCNINLLRQGRVLYDNRLYLKICKVENKLSKKLSLQLVHLSLPSNLRTRKSFSSRELCALTGTVKNEELFEAKIYAPIQAKAGDVFHVTARRYATLANGWLEMIHLRMRSVWLLIYTTLPFASCYPQNRKHTVRLVTKHLVFNMKAWRLSPTANKLFQLNSNFYI